MLTLRLQPTDKRAFGRAVGDELLRRHGKRHTYSLDRIHHVTTALGFPAEWAPWAFALYAAPEDVAAYHAALGDPCDYAELKAEMFDAMTEGESTSWFDVGMSWLEWPGYDFATWFRFFDL